VPDVPRSFEIEVEVMGCRDFAEDVLDELLETLPDDLSPLVSE
jgi:hypothetical protein